MSDLRYNTSWYSEEQLVHRAMAAYWRAAKREGAQYPIPANDSYVTELNGKQYVVLQNINGILAVYRVRPSDGILREMKRWPKELSESRE